MKARRNTTRNKKLEIIEIKPIKEKNMLALRFGRHYTLLLLTFYIMLRLYVSSNI